MLRTRIGALLTAVAMLAPLSACARPAERITVLIDTADASVLDEIDGARLIHTFDAIGTLAAEIPAYAADTLRASPAVSSLSEEAVFSFAPAGEWDADAALASDSVLRARDVMDGDGTVIAVIDTGFDLTHEVFTLPDGAQTPIVPNGYTDFIYETNAASLAFGATGGTDVLVSLYRSAKVPFAFDYAGRDTDVGSGNAAHGTHVAALAAAYGADGERLGAAPAAQLLLMKVFSDDGNTCREIDLMCAVEDAVRLGADVINLSLGTIAVNENSLSMERLARTIRYAESEGVVVVCATGNDGVSGIGGAHSDTMRTDNPDTALSSEPAILPETLAVGAADNALVWSPTLTVGEKTISYGASLECEEGLVPALTAVLGGQTLTLVHVPGVGDTSDFDKVDVSGKLALVSRGVISFEEKISNAAAAGAVGVIIYNTKDAAAIVMTVGNASLPAVSVSYEDGTYLASLDGQALRIPTPAEQYTAAALPIGAASYSSRGPSASLTRTPDLIAVGSDVLSAVPGGYGIMHGTSMAAPQIAGAAAAYIGHHRASLDALDKTERASQVKNALMSAAVPLTDEDGVPVSPRAQGAGALTVGADPSGMTVTVTDADGAARVSLGDGLLAGVDIVVFTVTVTNGGSASRTLRADASVVTEGAVEKDGVWYTTNASVPVPAEVGISDEYFTLAPGASKTLTVGIRPDEAFLKENAAIWTNGFFIEGFVTFVGEDGAHAASIPYFGFAGDWSAADALDGGDWDGFESFYGGQTLYLINDSGTMRPAGSDSTLFAFSPNGDGAGEEVFFRVYPLRSISRVRIAVTDEDGETLYTETVGDIMKSYVSDSGLTYADLPLWDGADGVNERYFFPDGQYAVRITATSYAGGEQTIEIPLKIDTVKPRVDVSVEDGTVIAEATDAEMLYSLRIYAPNTADIENPFFVNENAVETARSLTLTADVPDGVPYVYVRAEDCAGNVTTVRCYLDAKEGA